MTIGVEVWSVLAGAYRGRDIAKRSLHTHAVKVADGYPVEAACQAVRVEHLCKPEDGPPTCPRCLDRVWGARKKLEALAWRATHKDFRGVYPEGVPSVLIGTHEGTKLVPMSVLLNAELAGRLSELGQAHHAKTIAMAALTERCPMGTLDVKGDA